MSPHWHGACIFPSELPLVWPAGQGGGPQGPIRGFKKLQGFPSVSLAKQSTEVFDMKTLQKGFTLIELMIVVAIIAILAAIAIPAYQDYVIRSQVSEGATLADGMKTAVAEYYSNYGVYPSRNASAGLATPTSIQGKYVSQVCTGTTGCAGAGLGIIRVTYSNTGGHVANSLLNGKFLGLSAYQVANGGSIAWHCGNTTYTTVPSKYLPSSCRGAGQ